MPYDRWSLRARLGLEVAVLVILLALVAPTNAAQATNFGSSDCDAAPRNCVSLTDDSRLDWYPEGVLGDQIAGIAPAVELAMSAYDRSSDLTVVRRLDLPRQDVLVTDSYYGDIGIYGWVECLPGSAVTGEPPYQRCDRQKIRLNGEYSFDLNGERRISLACHEIGHTVGLRHTTDPDSCMNSTRWVRAINAHDNAHLDATY